MMKQHSSQLEQTLIKAQQQLSECEQKLEFEAVPEQQKKLKQRIHELRQLLSMYGATENRMTSAAPIESERTQPQASSMVALGEAHSASLFKSIPDTSATPVESEPEWLAAPHWFTDEMLTLLLANAPEDTDQRNKLITKLLENRQIARIPGSKRYCVPELERSERLNAWQTGDNLGAFTRVSATLVSYCEQRANESDNEIKQNEWRAEQLYHLAVCDPDGAMSLLHTWFDESVNQRFDLNQGHCWLTMLEERRDLLKKLENQRTPPAHWTEELTQRREYLSARAFWIEEWFRTVNYQERDDLKEQIESFLTDTDASAPWLLSLYADGGYGKTATIQWLLARYLLPRGFICARFDYDALPINDLRTFMQRPQRLLDDLAANLNNQRPSKVKALERQSEFHQDQVDNFTLLLHENYGGKPIVFFIDTLEKLLEYDRGPDENDEMPEGDSAIGSGEALANLLSMFVTIREGNRQLGGSTPGYINLHVVLSGRQSLLQRYRNRLDQAFMSSMVAQSNPQFHLPLIELPVLGFTQEEGRRYLLQKRKLTYLTDQQLNAILAKAAAHSSASPSAEGTLNEGRIMPLKLAQYADLVIEDPKMDVANILANEDIDSAYLVKRIIERIPDPAIHWLLRYGVIFRRLDIEAAQVLLSFLKEALKGQQNLDQPDLDPTSIRLALEASRQQAGKPVEDIQPLFSQLTRYSWVDRQGDYLIIHPEVSKPQLQIVAKQKIFPTLQQAAFKHYRKLIDRHTDPRQQANDLREAIYHVLQMGEESREESRKEWQKLMDCYRSGPALMLWTLVDETFLQPERPWPPTFIPDKERLQAYLDVANLLFDEVDQPSIDRQLEVAEDLIQKAQAIVAQRGIQETDFALRLLSTRIALARRQLPEALQAAEQSAEEATTSDQTTSDQRAMTLLVRGEAEAANSLWEKGRATLSYAYHFIKKVWRSESLAKAYRLVCLELIRQQMNSSDWRYAVPLLQEVRTEFPDDPDVLKIAARMAFKRAHFKEARELFQRAITLGRAKKVAKRTAELQMVQLYQGEYIPLMENDTSMLAVTAAAMHANWLKMENLLDIQLVEATEAKNLDVINTLLHYYVEVMGDWRQVASLRERGAKWAKRLSDNDPAVARYSVLCWYIDFLASEPLLQPEVAWQEYEKRLQQIEELRTPEARVRAKAYLLLVRFYGYFYRKPAQPTEQTAIEIYRRCAAEALERTLKLLLQLAPLDQVDVMRTLAALPGWSSSLLNHVALDPSERSPLVLLAQSMADSTVSGSSLPFLASLASIGNAHQIKARLETLKQQILMSGADWPLLYTSFARLLAAFGQDEDARQFFSKAKQRWDAHGPHMRVLIDQDYAFIVPWEEGYHRLALTISDIELRLPAEVRGHLIDEIRLIRAYLNLDKGTNEEQWRLARDQLKRKFLHDPGNTRLLLDFLTLRAVCKMKLHKTAKMNVALQKAAEVALDLGNTYAVTMIKAARDQLHTEISLTLALEKSGQPAADQLTAISSPTPGWSTEEKQELELALKQLNDYQVEVTLRTPQPVHRQFHFLTNLHGIKQLLPQGTALETLPDSHYWQKLLATFSLAQIGTTLLDDLLPVPSEGRSFLEQSLQQAIHSLRFTIQGAELECLPWGILHAPPTWNYLAAQICYTYNYPPEKPLMLQGGSLVVYSSSIDRAGDPTFYQLQSLYGSRPTSQWFYCHDLLGKGGPSKSVRSLAESLLKQVKMLHIVGDLSQFDEVEGIFLNMGSPDPSGTIERLTPDHLARRLRQLNISNCLIVLEPLSTGSNIEDVRLLMLRNSYATALARLGPWAILALGPRHSPTTTKLVEQLLDQDTLTSSLLEKNLLEARQAATTSTTPDFSGLLEGQFELFYPCRT